MGQPPPETEYASIIVKWDIKIIQKLILGLPLKTTLGQVATDNLGLAEDCVISVGEENDRLHLRSIHTTLQLDMELAIVLGFGLKHLVYKMTQDGGRSDRVTTSSSSQSQVSVTASHRNVFDVLMESSLQHHCIGHTAYS